MRNIFNKLILLAAAGTLFTGCEENAIPELAAPLTDEVARAKFFFHAEDAPPANFYFDDEKVTARISTTSDEEQGFGFGSVFPGNAYAVVPSGSSEIRALDLDLNEIAFTQESLSPGSTYSVYLVGTEENLEVFTMEDNLPADDPVKINWRFVNTMADMPFAVDAYAVRAPTPESETSPAQPLRVIELGKNIGFKEGGEYVELEPGNYTFKIFNASSNYDPETSTPYLEHSVNVATLGRTYTTQIRGTYSDPPGSGKIDFWRDR